MKLPQSCYRCVAVTAALAILCATGIGAAEAQGPPAKDKTPKTVEIDLSKLPPELAKHLLDYLKGTSKMEDPKEKTRPDDKKGTDKDTPPPTTIPPADAKGKKLGDFIMAKVAKGLTGPELAAAIAKERKRLGLTDDDPEREEAPAPKK